MTSLLVHDGWVTATGVAPTSSSSDADAGYPNGHMWHLGWMLLAGWTVKWAAQACV